MTAIILQYIVSRLSLSSGRTSNQLTDNLEVI